MDHDIKAFRAAAARENGSRTGLQRRYSAALRIQAVGCWRIRQRAPRTHRRPSFTHHKLTCRHSSQPS